MRSAELYCRLEEISEDAFVLHGSPQKLTQLEPRQTSFNASEAFSQHGLYATTCVEIALLYALIHEPRDKWGWHKTFSSSKIQVRAFENCKYGPGYLHIIRRKPFRDIKEGDGLIQITRKPVRALEILEVDGFVLQELRDRERLDIFLRTPPHS